MSNFLAYEEIQQQAQVFADKLAKREAKNGYDFEGLFTYTDQNGIPVYWKIRLKNYATGDKWIRVFSSGERGFIIKEPDFKASYPLGNGKKPLYALAEISKAPENTEIWLFEGEQKADLAHSLGFVSTTCGGSNTVDTTDLNPLAGKTIIVWRDNDRAGIEYQDNLALKLHDLGCNVQLIDMEPLNLPAKGDIVDWVNLRKDNGQDTTTQDMQSLSRQAYSPPSKLPYGTLAESMEWAGGHFEIVDKGVFFIERQKSGEAKESFISSPILVLAQTRDNTGNNWGRLLQWNDNAQNLHTWAVPMELFQGDGTESRKALSNQGVTIMPDRRSRDLLQCYLMSYPVDKFALCVDSVGWHKNRYVLPTETFSNAATVNSEELIVYQRSDGLDNRYQHKGDLEQWKTGVSLLLESHSKLVFSVACAFAGQLLEPLNQQGGGFHLNGTSSKGKSTAIYLGCSVWGHPKEYYRTWRSTGNALEQTAYMHNDGFLVLDEIGEATAKDIGQTIYMLANGQGKARMARTATVSAPKQWRVLFLSSGEKTLKEILSEIGQNTKLGQEIRLPEISVDSSEYGIFDSVDFAEEAAQQANILYENSVNAYGVAGRAWLEYLTNDKDKASKLAGQLHKQYLTKITPHNAQGHISRVASRFAIVAVAGELATQAGITGWQKGRALEAITSVFNTWLNNFEMVGDYEDRLILEHVRGFFEANGNSRFDTLTKGQITPIEKAEPEDSSSTSQTIRAKTIYRVGYRQLDTQGKLLAFLVFNEQFKQAICGEFDPRKVAKVLVKHKWLDHEKGKSTKPVRGVETKHPVRMYVFNESVFSYDIEKATNPYAPPPAATSVDI